MKEEWKNLLHSTWIKVVLIAIVIIPMLYAGIFLGSMWDPYGNVDKIPVAVVNQDEEVMYQGKALHVGNELCDNLKENHSMGFQFMKEKEAKDGLEKGNYYMMITIPKDFSYNATTLLQSNPQKMVLQYTTNPGTNYIASKMDESAMKVIKDSVSASVTKTYADTLFASVETLSGGLQDASDGSAMIDDGMLQSIEGNKKIQENLKILANSTLRFQDGSETLQEGLFAYTQGVSNISEGSSSLSYGLHTLYNKSDTLKEGLSQLQIGSNSLAMGITSYTNGVDDISNGLKTLTSNHDMLKNGWNQLSLGSTQAKEGGKQLAEGMQEMSDQLSQNLSLEKKEMLAKLQTGNQEITQQNAQVILNLQQKVATGSASVEEQQLIELLQHNNEILSKDATTLTSLSNGLQDTATSLDTSLLPGMIKLNLGIDSLEKGVNGDDRSAGLKNSMLMYMVGVENLQIGNQTLMNSSESLRKGANKVSSGTTQLHQSIPTLQGGIEQLTNGSITLHEGSKLLVKNSPALLSGFSQLKEGANLLSSGAFQLTDGNRSLTTALIQVKEGTSSLTSSLKNGAKQSSIKTNSKTVDMLVQPVNVKHIENSVVENNGKAMAPYMMSVALYVACMAFTLMYPLLKNHTKTTSGFKLWLSKASVMYVISSAMAFLMVTALILINGLSPIQIVGTYLMAMLISAAFMSMIVFFNIMCGKIGAFLVLIFMVFQLGGAAGTYPIETSNAFYNAIHPFMPFTYSVDAFRHSLVLGGFVIKDIMIFASITLIFSFLSIMFYHWFASKGAEHFENTLLARFHS